MAFRGGDGERVRIGTNVTYPSSRLVIAARRKLGVLVTMDVSRRALGLILLVTGLVLMVSYFALVETYVGPIAELVGVGFCFMFLGLLTTVGEIMGLYTEGDR
jgi:hypothetical protein